MTNDYWSTGVPNSRKGRRKKRRVTMSEAIGVTRVASPGPHRAANARMKTRRESSRPPPSQALRQPPIEPETNHMDERRTALRERQAISEAARRGPPTVANID